MPSPYRALAVLGLIGLWMLPASAQAPRCTSDAFKVDGTPVSATFCIPEGAGGKSVSVSETFTSPGGSASKQLTFEIVSGAEVSRTMDEIDLSPLGPKKTLHMSLIFRGGKVTLEHALVTPGAVTVK